MKTAIDRAGRVLIPKRIRERAALEPGTELDARYEGGRIVLEPRPLDVRIEKQGRFFVAEPLQAIPAMPAHVVEREIEAVRGGRGGDD